jgi:hypothetical protein
MTVLAMPPRPAVAVSSPRTGLLSRYASRFVVAALLLINVPPFVRMGLDSDVTLYDLCARTILDGGTYGRDVFENNLPGMVWLHAGLRAAFGWRPEVLRLADVLVVLAVVWLLARSLPESVSGSARGWAAAAMLIFYFSTSEWCHCQRDTWMLLPALLAVRLRARPGASFLGGVVEGALWGAAFWIKPYVAVPALACWLVSVVAARRVGRPLGRVALDGAAVLLGGAAAGAAGVVWLWLSGAWPYFADIMFVWNREYVTADLGGDQAWLLRWGFLLRFFPWALVHVVAVPLAVGRLREVFRGAPAQGLLAACYLGWTFQAFALQHLFDYVHVAPILLGLTVIAGRVLTPAPARWLVAAVVLFGLCVAARFPAVMAVRLAAWPECFRQSSGGDVRDRLTLSGKVDWADLRAVAAFLARDGAGDEEVTCFSMTTVPLYQETGLTMPTRYVFVHNVLTIFPSGREQVREALVASRQRYVVCDLRWFEMDHLRQQLDDGTSPWSERVAFRAGRYLVFRLSGPEMPAWLEDNFGL